jgi:hypothetical protein
MKIKILFKYSNKYLILKISKKISYKKYNKIINNYFKKNKIHKLLLIQKLNNILKYM